MLDARLSEQRCSQPRAGRAYVVLRKGEHGRPEDEQGHGEDGRADAPHRVGATRAAGPRTQGGRHQPAPRSRSRDRRDGR